MNENEYLRRCAMAAWKGEDVSLFDALKIDTSNVVSLQGKRWLREMERRQFPEARF